MGGSFTQAGGASHPYITAWTGSAFTSLSSPLTNSVFAIFYASATELYVGGSFTGTYKGLVVYDGTSSWLNVNQGVNGTVRTITANQGSPRLYLNLYLGGEFTASTGGVTMTRTGFAYVTTEVTSIFINGGTAATTAVLLKEGSNIAARWNNTSTKWVVTINNSTTFT